MPDKRSTGLTRDAGWQIGAQKTVACSREDAWTFLVSRRGLAVWLGEGAMLGHERGARYETSDGTTGELRSFHPLDRIRLTWRPAHWDHDSTVELAVRDRNGKAVVIFHQERLASASERAQMRVRWKRALDAIACALDDGGARSA